MKLNKTNKFRVLIDTPLSVKGTVVVSNTTDYSKYPDYCTPLYEFFDDGTLVALNDTVYRITGSYDRVVKAIKLQEAHINGEVEVFLTKEKSTGAFYINKEELPVIINRLQDMMDYVNSK